MRLSLCLLCLLATTYGANIFFSYPTDTSVWYRGDSQTVAWSSVNDANGAVTTYRLLELHSGPTNYGLRDNLITSWQPPSFNSINYLMSTLQAFDSDYAKFRIHYTDATGNHSIDSPSFTIEQAPWQISITKPAQYDEWALGATYQITWTSTGNISAVKIETATSSSPSTLTGRTLIVASTPNTGTYDWTVPANFPLSSYLYIMISKVTYAPVHDPDTGTPSNRFEITSALSDILVTSPTSASVWKIGTTKPIQWICVGDIYTLKIELTTSSSTSIPPPTALMQIANNVECGLGQYNWNVPSSLSTQLSSNYFYIRISSVNKSAATAAKVVVSPRFDFSTTQDTDPALDPVAVYSQTCDDKCWNSGLSGDSLCACTRLCGRLCLSGYKDALSGFNPFTQKTTRLIFNYTLVRSGVFDAGVSLGTFYVPPNLSPSLESVEIQTASTSIVETLSGYQSLISFGASVGAGGDETSKVEGTLSTEYQNTREKLQTKSIRLGYKSFNRYMYKVTTQDTSPSTVQFNSFFQTDLNALPPTYNYVAYKAFLDKYGLYFFDYIVFGVSATITSLVNECLFKASSSDSVSVGLDAAAKTSEVQGSVSFTQAEQNARSCLAGKTEATLKLLGGDFSKYACAYDKEEAEFKCNGTWSTYADTAKYNPYRLEYQLTRISSLMSDPVLKQNLDQAITQYLSEVNATVTEVFPKAFTEQPCPCDRPGATTADDITGPQPVSQQLIIGLVVGGIIVAIIVAGVVKQYVCAPREPAM